MRIPIAMSLVLVGATVFGADDCSCVCGRGAQVRQMSDASQSGYFFQNGKVMVMRDGTPTEITQEMTFDNGMRLQQDGTIIMVDGSRRRLEDNQWVSLNGTFGDRRDGRFENRDGRFDNRDPRDVSNDRFNAENRDQRARESIDASHREMYRRDSGKNEQYRDRTMERRTGEETVNGNKANPANQAPSTPTEGHGEVAKPGSNTTNQPQQNDGQPKANPSNQVPSNPTEGHGENAKPGSNTTNQPQQNDGQPKANPSSQVPSNPTQGHGATTPGQNNSK